MLFFVLSKIVIEEVHTWYLQIVVWGGPQMKFLSAMFGVGEYLTQFCL